MLTKKMWRKIDYILLPVFPILAIILSLLFKVNYLISTLLFFGVPSLYWSLRRRDMILKVALFSFIVTIPVGFIVDYINVINKSWSVPTIFSFRILGVPIEDFVWLFFITFAILMFYEHFLNKGKKEVIDKRMKYFILPMIVVLILLFAIALTKPELLKIKYAYFWTTLVLLFIPIVIFLSSFPKMLSKYIKVGLYFFVVLILMEITGLQLGHWIFHGNNFIAWIELFGYRFPFEEFFFLIVLGSSAALTYYEFFDDDRK